MVSPLLKLRDNFTSFAELHGNTQAFSPDPKVTLYVSNHRFQPPGVRYHLAIERVGQVSLQASHRFSKRFAFLASAGDVFLGFGIGSVLRERDVVQCVIEPTVAGSVQSESSHRS